MRTDDLSVALLVSDMKHTKELSDALRSFGVFPHFYRELDELWVAVNQQLPDLVVVDVTKMSQGTLVLKNHPRIIDGKLNLSFFFSPDSKFLLNSTFHMNNFGVIDSTLNLKGQVESILLRLSSHLESVKRSSALNSRIDRLQTRTTRVLKEYNDLVEFTQGQDEVKSIINKIETRMRGSDFTSALVSSLNEWKRVEQFTYFELNPSGQRLISGDFVRSKFIAMPALWLGQECKRGIEPFAIEMAQQVSMEVIDGVVDRIELSGKFDQPSMIIFVKKDIEATSPVDWDMFKVLLQSSYRNYLLNTQKEAMLDRVINAWDALAIQDEIHYQQRQADIKLVNISFATLLGTIRSKYTNRFYWKAFCRDFMSQLEDHLTDDTIFSFYGAHELVVFCEKDHFESNFTNLDKFVREFTYWKYFEDSSTVLSSNIRPNVKIIPPSALNYLRFVEDDFDGVGNAVSRSVVRASEILNAPEV